ncbi:MAG: ExeM/NucH family extracellular endonuclease, partial [Pseudomonadota bacterium]|nr:ExeM/NucH family extracellular endonuclease [Pseudomonadota bacterium]
GLEQALVSWDSGNAHGKGANHYGLAASSAGGVVPEAPNGFSIEGMAATASGQLLLGFRAPQASAATRTQALLVPLTNPQAVLTGSAPVFGVPIELNLGGRGVRSIERAGDGKFIIVAGPAGAVTTTAGSSHFALYVWDGTSPTATRLDNALDALLASTQGSFETVVAAPASTAPGTRVQLLQDNGDTLWPGKRVPSKSLPPAEQQFMGNWVTLGQPVAADTTPPALLSSVPAHNATGVGLRDAITLTFNEAVRRGTGRFELRQGATVVDTLAATDARVAFSGNTVTITPAARAANTAYTLVPVGQPVLDEAGNAWVGGSPLVFTTGAAPVAPTYSLLISEVNSNAPGEDFFELYNFGTTAIDLSGWRWIDDSGTFDHTAAGTFPAGSTLAPGATVVVLQKAPVDGFRSAWGLVASSPVWLVPGPGLGGGDAVLLYDADANLAAAVNYGTKTIAATGGLAVAPSLDSAGTAARGGHAGPAFAIGTPLPADGVSAVWDGQSTSAPRYTPAVVGTLGAFAQPGAAANIGSPGIPGVTVTPPGPSITRIHAIQGRGETSPLDGQRVTVQAVVTAHMPGLNGFFLQEQEADYDQDPLTSEGVFVFYGSATSANPNPNPGVSEATVGQRVRLTATVGAFRNQTQLAGSITDFSVLGAGAMPAPAVIQLPVSDMAVLEAHEGMRVEVRAASGGPLVVTDNYSLGRFGTVALSPDTPQVQFTEVNAPSGPGFSDFVQANRRAQIILDDGRSAQNPDPTRGRSGQSLSASNTLRVGDSVTSVVGVLDELYDTSAQPHQTSYRVQPTVTPVFTGAARPTADDFRQAVGPATVKVAAANVLNFFNIVGATSGSSQVMFTTPLGNRIGIRGANNADELKRQTDKIIAMLIGMDADVIGLMEIQNNGFGTSSALAVLTQALNASADKPAGAQFDYVKGPFTDGTRQDIAGAGDDAITVAFIYRADRVTPQGQAAVANTSAYPAFTAAGGHRVPLAQTFSVPVAGGGSAQFTVVANHFKSKGSLLPGAANADQFDGQGNNNAARVQAAQQLNDWLKNLPAGTVSPNVVLLGDFNAYAKEDPITTLEGHGWRKVSEGFSYQFRGLQGSLDHILVSPQLIGRVGHTVKWAINAEEPAVLDYNLEYKSPAQQASFYAPTAYSSSDHNPIVMGLNFGNQPPTLSGVPATARDVVAGQAFDLSGLAVADADGDRLTLTINATGVRVLGLADADAAQPGIQLQGTADELNALLAQAVLIADAAGNASVAFSLSDGVNPPVAATLVLQVAAVGAAHPANQFSVTPGGQGSAITGSVSGGGATCRVVPTPEAVTLAAAGASGLPRTGLAAPWGMLRLGTEGCDTGALVTVTLHFPADLPANAEYWKWGRTADNATARWYLLPATVNGRTVTFALRDGGLGDDDMQADGRITDPGGLFVPIATGGPGGTGPAAVPTLSQWALMLMALAMACLAGGRARRRG